MSEKVSANTDDLWGFVESGASFVATLETMAGELESVRSGARQALQDVGAPPSSSDLSLREVIVEARNNNEFVLDLHDSLKRSGTEADGITSAPAVDIDAAMRAAGHEPYTGDRTLEEDMAYEERLARDDVMEAMEQGLHPDETDFPSEYFPQGYRDMQDLDAEIAQLEADREDADGSSWSWWDSDDERLAEIDAELVEKRQQRADLAGPLGANGSGRLTDVEAIAVMGDWTGDRTWEGEQYGHWTNEYYEANLLDGRDGQVVLNDHGAEAHGDEFARIGNELESNPEIAVAYYNEIGVEGSSFLPTVLANSLGEDQEKMDEVLDSYSAALGDASRQDGPDDKPRLEFTGDELMAGPRVDMNGAWGLVYNPAYLFVSGDFDQQFLVDATAESMRQAEEDPSRAASITRGGAVYDTHLPNEGEDARNILLARSSEDPTTTFAVVAELDSTNDLDLLLSPDVPFPGTYRGDEEYQPHPPLESDAPVTTFLVIAGSDDRTANTVMIAAAEDPEPFSDPSVAAGIDGIMAQHATLMYDPEDLDAVGIDRTGINDLSPPSQEIDADAWRTVHGKVLEYGRGGLLVVATEDLVDQAIDGALEYGESNLDMSLVDPFATMAGTLGAETAEGYFTYYEGLDEAARQRNREVNTAVSVGLGIVGLPNPALGVGATLVSGLYTYHDPFAVPTDGELRAYREQYARLQYVGQDRGVEWREIIYHRCLDLAIEGNGATIRDPDDPESTRQVTVRKSFDENGDPIYEWELTEGQWTQVPPTFRDDHKSYFAPGTPIGSAVGQAFGVHDNYMDGVLVSADDRDEVVRWRDEDRVKAAEDGAADHDVKEWVADG